LHQEINSGEFTLKTKGFGFKCFISFFKVYRIVRAMFETGLFEIVTKRKAELVDPQAQLSGKSIEN